jgi:alpha-L-fucosidase
MKYENNMKSLMQYDVPEWYKDAKFGIFIHWGVYSVPAKYTEWYPRYLYHTERSLSEPEPHYVDGEFRPLTKAREIERRAYFEELLESHTERYGALTEFGYKDFIPLFTGHKFDPQSWTELFKKSGARYIVPVAEHHDGFSMYPTALNPWNASEMGPKRNIIGELQTAAAKQGLRFGVSSHRAWNWRYYNYDVSKGYDNTDPAFESFYGKPHGFDDPPSDEFVDDWFARTSELIEKFELDLLYFDFGWHESIFEKYYSSILSQLYNEAEERGTGAVLAHKGCLPDGVAVYDIERGNANDIIKHYWQGDTSVSHKGWSHLVNDNTKPPARLIYDMVDVVSKNGNFLLNVGPRADGIIPEEVAGTLLAIGSWLDVNGDAIFGTRHWEIYGEQSQKTIARGDQTGHYSESAEIEYTHEDMRFTQKGNAVYAIMFDWPGKTASVKSFGKNAGLLEAVSEVCLLGCDEKLKWEWRDNALTVEMPAARPCDHAFVLKVT